MNGLGTSWSDNDAAGRENSNTEIVTVFDVTKYSGKGTGKLTPQFKLPSAVVNVSYCSRILSNR